MRPQVSLINFAVAMHSVYMQKSQTRPSGGIFYNLISEREAVAKPNVAVRPGFRCSLTVASGAGSPSNLVTANGPLRLL